MQEIPAPPFKAPPAVRPLTLDHPSYHGYRYWIITPPVAHDPMGTWSDLRTGLLPLDEPSDLESSEADLSDIDLDRNVTERQPSRAPRLLPALG